MLFFGLGLGPGMAEEGGWPVGCLGTPRFRAGRRGRERRGGRRWRRETSEEMRRGATALVYKLALRTRGKINLQWNHCERTEQLLLCIS